MSTSIRSMSLLLVSLVGCVANRTMVHVEPLQREGQDVTYRNGTPVMFSRGSYSDVILAPLGSSTGRYEIGTRLYLMVAVRSRYPSRIEVSEASFRVTGNGAPARVVPAIQLEDEIHWSAAFEQVANAFSGAFRSMAAQSAGTTTYSGRVGSSGTRIEGTPTTTAQPCRRNEKRLTIRQRTPQPSHPGNLYRWHHSRPCSSETPSNRVIGYPVLSLLNLQEPQHVACLIRGERGGRERFGSCPAPVRSK